MQKWNNTKKTDCKNDKRQNAHLTKYKYDMTQKDKNRYDKIQSSNNKAKKQKWQNTKRQITNVTKDKLQIRQNTNQSITNMKNYHVIFVICCWRSFVCVVRILAHIRYLNKLWFRFALSFLCSAISHLIFSCFNMQL